jgi:hypothetical protein
MTAGALFPLGGLVSLAGSNYYEFWTTRSFAGVFRVWIKGGAYTDWTLFFDETDATHTTSEYVSVSLPVAGQQGFHGITHYLGEMTPFEAIRAGILEGEIPEPFWTVTTTDTTQSWSVGLAAGGTLVIDWGDGTQDWYSTSGVAAITHTYVSAGTYTVKTYTSTPSKVYTLTAQANSLTGAFPSISNMSGLQNLYVFANVLTGVIPSLTLNVALVDFRAYAAGISVYTASIVAPTCTTFNVSNNALTLAAVDQILIDFTTGAAGRPAAGTINLSGGTNAVPTPAIKAACVSALSGWTVTTN